MMRVPFWRFLLTLSLLLTSPMQGYAAARMASCDAVLAGALAASGGVVMARHLSNDMSYDTSQDAAVSFDGDHGTLHHDPLHYGSTHHGIPQGDLQQGDKAHGYMHNASMPNASMHNHDVTYDGMHDSCHGTAHTAHGTSCTGCTPCSPGATLTCVAPVFSAFLSARFVPAILIAPTSADLAHPERPPQAFLA